MRSQSFSRPIRYSVSSSTRSRRAPSSSSFVTSAGQGAENLLHHLHGDHRRLLGRSVVELQVGLGDDHGVLADGELGAVRQRVLLVREDLLPVDEGTHGRAQIDEVGLIPFDDDPRVLRGDLHVGNLDVVLGMPADRDEVLLEREVVGARLAVDVAVDGDFQIHDSDLPPGGPGQPE